MEISISFVAAREEKSNCYESSEGRRGDDKKNRMHLRNLY